MGEAEELFRDTVVFWRGWLSKCTYAGRWREMVHRSALTLKLLSLSEPVQSSQRRLAVSPGDRRERNWDYRYTWIRDAAFTLYGLLRIGFTEEAARFLDWLKDRWQDTEDHASGPLQLMYSIEGRADLTEQTLDHLEGYRGSGPVRIGNGHIGCCSSTSTGSRRMRFTSTTSMSSLSAMTVGCICDGWWIGFETTGSARMRAFGRCVAGGGTSCIRSACPGWPSTAACDWLTSAPCRRTGNAG